MPASRLTRFPTLGRTDGRAPDPSDSSVGPLRRGVLAVSVTALTLVGLTACSSSGSKSTGASTPATSSVAAVSTSDSAVASSAAPTTAATSSPATSTPATSTPATSSPATSSAAAPATSRSKAAAKAPAAAAMIMIKNFKYTVPASVQPGATVEVMNMDSEAHTVTADKDKAFDDKASPGKVTTFKAPTKAGSYPFHCTYHSNMHGVLTVK